MKKTVFKSHILFWILIIYIGALMIWNLFLVIAHSKFLGLLPFCIQAILLGLIISRHKYAKIGIKIWTIAILTVASGLQFFGRLLQDIADNFSNPEIKFYLTTGITLIVGLLLTEFTNKTVELIDQEKAAPNSTYPQA